MATNIANSGSYSFTVPNIAAPYCRLLIEPTNHVFYAINTHDFAINYEINTTCVQYRSADNLGISITDNGKGFVKNKKQGIGLRNINERLQKINGTLDIDSSSNHGTSITIDIPTT